MRIVRKVKRNALAKAIKERDLQLQEEGFKANQGRIEEKFLVKKKTPFRKTNKVDIDLEI